MIGGPIFSEGNWPEREQISVAMTFIYFSYHSGTRNALNCGSDDFFIIQNFIDRLKEPYMI